MFKKMFKLLFRGRNQKIIQECKKVVEKVNALEGKFLPMSDEELRAQTSILRGMLSQGSTLEEILPSAFAVVREAAKRLLNMRHYDVQMIGGILLHRGCVAEMKTGEGKTLSATLPTYLNALTGKVHIITVNDYLAKRDHDWMGRIFQFLGLSVAYITSQTSQEERIEAYKSDVVYVTNSEIGFDYLKDNMQIDASKVLLGAEGFQYAIVDEIDSILIDEARTPLIVSGPSRTSSGLYIKVDKIARKVRPEDFVLDEKRNTVQLLESGEDFVEAELKKEGLIPQGASLYEIGSYSLINHVLQSLKAHHCFRRDRDYIVVNNSVMLIDEFTGRVAEGRRYSGGLHQAIEAKEGAEIGQENQTLASVTYQNFFRMYKKLSGMTGTAMTEAKEFFSIYNLEVFAVPTFRPVIRKDHQDLVFRTEEEKLDHIVSVVQERNKKGQPILIGTVSIEKSEILSKKLRTANVEHNVLNAKYHEKEAEIIAEAGRKGAVTIATNMAGRGTDILLGGSIDSKTLKAIDGVESHEEVAKITERIRAEHAVEKEEVVSLGGLFVIGSERHESRRVDNQLQGRAGRLGDPGESQFFLCLTDDLLRIFGGGKLDGILSKLGLKDGESMQHSMLDNVIERSQRKLESFHYDIRKNVVRYDDVINEQRKLVYAQRWSFLEGRNLSTAIESVVKNMNNSIANGATRLQNSVSKDEILHELKVVYKEKLLEKISTILETQPSDISEEDLPALTDGISSLILSEYEAKINKMGEMKNKVEQFVLLNSLDSCWQDHLEKASHIREGIHLRAYGNKDPFIEYKREMFLAIEEMFYNFEFLVIQHLVNIDTDTERPFEQSEHYQHFDAAMQNVELGHQSIEHILKQSKQVAGANKGLPMLLGEGHGQNIPSAGGQGGSPKGALHVPQGFTLKQGRNDKCACGSGLKYKNCHGKHK